METPGGRAIDRSLFCGNAMAPDEREPDLWLRELRLSSDDHGRTIQWTIWPAVSLKGSFDQNPSIDPILTIRPVRSDDLRADFEEASVPCDAEGREFRCRVPAIPLDVRVAAEGFAPHYLFGHDPRATTSLGVISLRKGGSVSGFVQLPRAAVEAATTLTLEPETGAAGGDRLRLGLRSLTAKANDRGFFQFTGVPAGRYTLIARAGGYSAATIYALEVDPDDELFVEQPLIISPLSALEVGIEPPVSSGGTPWRVTLARHRPVSEYLEPIAEGEASIAGWFSYEGLDQGEYRATVWSSGGEPVASESIDVRSEKQIVHIRLEQIPVEGSLSRGDTPLSGSLTFRHPSGQKRIMKADQKGAFEGVLPKEGVWDVSVSPAGDRGSMRLEPVPVHRPDDGSPVRLRLAVPPGSLNGVVKDRSGNGTPATVFVTSGGGGVVEGVIETEADGQFVAWGLRPGIVGARAVTASAESPDVALEIDDETPANVTLVLEPFETIRGMVLDAAGNPVPGAAVRAWSAARPPRRALTGPSGRFEIKVIDARSTIVGVVTPSHAISFFSVDSRASLELRLRPGGSILGIELKKTPPWPYLLIDGTPVAIPDLFIPSSFPGGPPYGMVESGAELRLATRPYFVCPQPLLSSKCVHVDFGMSERVVVDATEWWTQN